MPSKSRSGNSANSKVTVSYDSIEYDFPNKRARITNGKMSFSSSSGWSDSSNRGRVRGGAVADDTVFVNATLNGGTNTWGVSETWVDLQYGNTTDVSFIGEVAGVSFYENDDNGDYFGPNLEVTFARVPYDPPLAPTGLLWRRISDTLQRVEWTGNQYDAAQNRYWETIEIEMQTDSETSAWVDKAFLTGYMTTMDIATTANHRYRIRVRAVNDDGVGPWATSAWLYTTPAAPTALSAARSSGNVNVTSPATAAPYRQGWQLQTKENETGSFVDLNDGDPITGTSYLHVGAAATSAWRYQVRNVATAVPKTDGTSTDLASAWVQTALLVALPDAPSAVTVKRKTAGDGTSVVGWSRAGTAGSTTKPYATQEVQYQLNLDTGPAVNVSTAVPAASTSVEHSTVVDSRYRYRVRAVNAAGASAWTAWSSWIATTPAAPVVGTPGKSGSTVVVANWTNTAPYRTGSRLGWSEDGGVEFAPGVSAAAGDSSASRTVNPAVTHAYRVYHVVAGVPLAAGGTVDLESAPSAWSATIQLQAPPAKPSIDFGSVLFDATTTALTVTVNHHPVDASDMTAVELEYRLGAGAWTTLTTSSTPALTMGTMMATTTLPVGTFANGNTYGFRARTKGADPAFSDWSTEVFVSTTGTPVATVTAPEDGGSVDVATLTIALGWYDPEGQPPTAWDVRLLDGVGAVVWSVESAPGTLSSTPYVVPGIQIADDQTYTVEARGRDLAGMWSAWDSSTFTVSYALPPEAQIVSTVWDDLHGTVTIEIVNPAPGVGEIDAVSQSVEWLWDGRWLPVAQDLPADTGASTFVVHRTPPTGEVTYRVVTVSEIPTILQGTPFVVDAAAQGWVYLNYGPGFLGLARVRGRLGKTRTRSREKALITPVGRDLPLELLGDARRHQWSVSGSIGKHPWQEEALGTFEEWDAVADAPAPICVRDYRGRRLFCSIDGVSADDVAGTISCNLMEIGYVE